MLQQKTTPPSPATATSAARHRFHPELPHKCMKDFDRELIFEVLNIYNRL